MTNTLLSVERSGISIGDLFLTQDTTFAIAAGERVGIVGESGCGKTKGLRLGISFHLSVRRVLGHAHQRLRYGGEKL